MPSLHVKQAFGGYVKEFKIAHVMKDVTPEVGVQYYFEKYIKGILHAARKKHSFLNFTLSVMVFSGNGVFK
mgnify:CR=1 FL=1